MGRGAPRSAAQGTGRVGQGDPEGVGKAGRSGPRHAPAVRNHVPGRVRRDAMAPEGTMHADAGRTRSQVRPELEARMMAGEPRTMNMIEAINSAMDDMLGSNDKDVGKGEEIGRAHV